MGKNRDLEAAVAAVRDEAVDPLAEQGAVARVRAALGAEMSGAGGALRIEDCADVQALFAAHRREALDPARTLLVRDHLRECAVCRAEWERPGRTSVSVMPWRREDAAGPRARWGGRWIAAAAAVGAVAALTLVAYSVFWGVPGGSRARIASTSGVLNAIAPDGTVHALLPGAEVGENESLRTARAGHAVVTLRDGSSVEMDERAQFAVSSRGVDTTIRLDRGSIIVKAAKRRSGHLYVATTDCRVAVTGTVFSVSRGLAGSRVSVVEGEVRVAHAGREEILHPGQQAVTSAAVRRVPVAQDVAWSRERDAHLALLAELSTLGEQWQALPSPALRHASRLLPLVPEDAAVYAALPNYGETLREGYALFKQRLEESETLRGFWEEKVPAAEQERVDEVVARLAALAEHIGPEVVIAMQRSESTPEVLVLAEPRDAGLRAALEEGLSRIAEGKPLPLRFVDVEGLAAAAPRKGEVLVLVTDSLLAVASRPALLQEVVARQSAGGRFAETSLGRRVTQAYAAGAGLLVAVDVERMVGDKHQARAGEGQALSTALRHIVVERKSSDERTENSMLFAFAGPRKGLSSWLAAPGPMGSLDFVSPEAGAVAAFVLRDPSALLEELLDRAKDRGAVEEQLARLDAELDLRLREDVVAALGNEIAVALDGPLLPKPSWKLIVEVEDAARLASSIERLAQLVNQKAGQDGRQVLRLDREESEGRVLYALRPSEASLPIEAHFAFVDGYLVATPSRALLLRAMETRSSGLSLARSDAFTALLPSEGDPYCSGVLYQNAGVVLGPLAEMLAGQQALGPEARQAVADMAARSRPSVITLRGESEAIRLAAVGTLPGLDPSSLALPALLSRTFGGTPSVARP